MQARIPCVHCTKRTILNAKNIQDWSRWGYTLFLRGWIPVNKKPHQVRYLCPKCVKVYDSLSKGYPQGRGRIKPVLTLTRMT